VNAQLKPVAPGIQRPQYDNHFVGHENDWINANYSALSDWFTLLSAEVGEPLCPDDFALFCRYQHELQQTLRTAYCETHSAWRDA
jgi:hypothetical protein